MSIQIADHVKHLPTGEEWVVARADEEHVWPAGWPPCIAKLTDCTLIKKATQDQREEMRRLCAALPASDPRKRTAELGRGNG